MASFCRACTIEDAGLLFADRNDFAGWLAEKGEEFSWGQCEGCGLHLIDNRGRKMCRSLGPSDPLAHGDTRIGCARCQQFQRRLFTRDEQFRNRTPWQRHEDAAVLLMVRQGLSNEQIAAKLFRAPYQIKTRLVEIGLSRFQIKRMDWLRLHEPWSGNEDLALMRMHGEHTSTAEIAVKLQRTPASVAQRLERIQRSKLLRQRGEFNKITDPYTPAELDLMTKMAKEGFDNIQIGATLGRTPASINRMLTKVGNPRGEDFCLNCGNALDHEQRRGRKRKYCDDQCGREYYYKVRRGEVQGGASAWGTPVAKVAQPKCQFCRKRKVGKNRTMYCDEKCQRNAARARQRAKQRATSRRQRRQAQTSAQASRSAERPGPVAASQR